VSLKEIKKHLARAYSSRNAAVRYLHGFRKDGKQYSATIDDLRRSLQWTEEASDDLIHARVELQREIGRRISKNR